MTGTLIGVWLNCKFGPGMKDFYSTDAGDTLTEFADGRVDLGGGYVAETTNIIGRRYAPGAFVPSYVCEDCGDAFASAGGLGNHRRFCKAKGAA